MHTIYQTAVNEPCLQVCMFGKVNANELQLFMLNGDNYFFDAVVFKNPTSVYQLFGQHVKKIYIFNERLCFVTDKATLEVVFFRVHGEPPRIRFGILTSQWYARPAE